MKIKQFFINHKVKILNLLKVLLSIVVLFLYSYTLFACGFCTREILETSEKIISKEKKERVDSSNITYINLLTDEVIDSDVHKYYNSNGSLVNSSSLTLTNKFAVNPSISYVYGNSTGQVAYVTFFDSNENFISSSTKSGLITTPSNAYFCALSVFNARLNDSYFYQGQVVYNYYLPPIQNLLDDEYDEGYDTGYNDSLVNIFTYSSFDNMPVLAILEDDNIVNLDSTDYTYDPTRFFKNNYVDLQYLRSLNISTSRYYIYWADSNYLLSDLNLSISGSTNNYNILVNNQSYVIGLNPVFIDSSELLNMISFDSTFLYNTRLTNHSIMFSQGFNKGYNTGYDFGYSDGTIYTEDYYDELILPSVRNEYYEIGYDSGYDIGYSDGSSYTENYYDTLVLPDIKTEYYNNGLLDGRAELNAILKPFELMSVAVEPVIVVLSSEIAPGITIGTIALIPLAVTMIVFLLKGLVL